MLDSSNIKRIFGTDNENLTATRPVFIKTSVVDLIYYIIFNLVIQGCIFFPISRKNKKAKGNEGVFIMKKILFGVFVCFLMLFPLASSAEEPGPVSVGKEYSVITQASKAYPDDGKKLTDGIFGTVPDGNESFYSSNTYVGFNKTGVDKNGNFVIILDLSERHEISSLSLGFLNETSAGIYAPRSVGFEISDDRNGDYTVLGSVKTEKRTDLSTPETFSASVETKGVSGRFIKITITPLNDFIDEQGDIRSADWTFVDEITVFGSIAAENPFADSELEEDIKPQAGDSRAGIIVFVLLSVSSAAMMIALFTGKEKDF